MKEKSATVKPTKEKRRNNEKRKEKSRNAARCRRSRETEIFTELAETLPLVKDETEHLDKTSIMRLVISYLRVRTTASQILPAIEEGKKDASIIQDEKFLLQALGGFLIMISSDGDIAYVSSNVAEYLGITQVDLMGQSIFDFSHPCDHEEIKEAASIKLNPLRDSRSIFPRMKCTLTSKGRNVNIKSANYKVIHFTGHILQNFKDNKKNGVTNSSSQQTAYFLAVARPIPHPSNIEIPLDSKTFLTKQNMKMKFTYVDDKMKELLGYESEDLLDNSVFDYHHAEDASSLVSSFKCLISKGQSETPQYRFLCRYGGYAWVVTQSTVIYDKLMKPQCIVSVHYLISGILRQDEIFSCAQLAANKEASKVKIEYPPVAVSQSVGDSNNNLNSQSIEEVCLLGPSVETSADPVSISVTAKIFSSHPDADSSLPLRTETATAKIFAPRTKEMNTGFLMFDEEVGKTVLKEEPEDLTHLAPTAGDVCIPLQPPTNAAYIIADAFDEFVLAGDTEAYLLTSDDADNDLNCSTFNNEPFLDYRHDNSSDKFLFESSSPSLLKSPCSLPSLCSPGKSPFSVDDGGGGGNGTNDFETPLNSFDLLDMGDTNSKSSISVDKMPIVDLDIRAPYISMNGIDDLPLLMSEDLMWGALPDHVDLHKDIQASSVAQKHVSPVAVIPSVSPVPLELTEESSALAQLLCTDSSDLFGASKSPSWSMKMDRVMDLQIEAAMTTYPVAPPNATEVVNRSKISNKRPHPQKTQTSNKRARNHDRQSATLQSNKGLPVVFNGKNLMHKIQIPPIVGQSSDQVAKREIRTPGCGSELRLLNPRPLHATISNNAISQAPQGVKQSSDSVLMNLLVSGCDDVSTQVHIKPLAVNKISSTSSPLQNSMDTKKCQTRRNILENCLIKHVQNSLLLKSKLSENQSKEPVKTRCKDQILKQYDNINMVRDQKCFDPIPSLLDLSQIDYDLNTPVNTSLLNGSDLLTALDGTLLS